MNTFLMLVLLIVSFSSFCRGQTDSIPDEFLIINETACVTWNSENISSASKISLYKEQVLCIVKRKYDTDYYAPYNSSTLNCSRIETSFTFCFARVSRNEAGYYKITIDNASSATGTVYVMDKPETPKIFETHQGIEGGILNISCGSASNSLPHGQTMTYFWFVNGSGSLPSRFQSSDSILTISNLHWTDSTYEIQCYANETNGLTSDLSSTHRADFHYGPGDTIDITWNGTYPLIEDSSVLIPPFRCSAICNPVCTYTWTGPFRWSYSSQYLNLGSVHRNKTGLYNCTATNKAQGYERHAQKGIFIYVSYPTSVVTISPSSPKLEINENANQELNCDADGYPQPSISWYKDGQFLKSSNKYNITNADCLSSGNYTCTAENYYGGSNKSIILRAKCSPRLYNDVSSMVIDVTDFEVQTLTVHMMGYPPPEIVWYHEMSGSNKTLDFNVSTIQNKTDLLTSSLNIYPNEKEDFGEYIAVAVGTSAGKRFYLQPNRRPNAPFNIRADCRSNSIANVSWISAFNGGHRQTFTVLYGVMNDNSVMMTSQRYPDIGHEVLHFILVANVLKNREYEFFVNAENTRGISTSTSIKCTVRDLEQSGEDSTLILAAGFGTALGAAAIIVLFVVILILYRKGVFSTECKKDEGGTETENQTAYDGLDFQLNTDQMNHTYQDLTDNKGAENDEDKTTYYNEIVARKQKIDSLPAKKGKKDRKGTNKTESIKKLDGNKMANHIYENSNTKNAPGKIRQGKAVLQVVYENTVSREEVQRKAKE